MQILLKQLDSYKRVLGMLLGCLVLLHMSAYILFDGEAIPFAHLGHLMQYPSFYVYIYHLLPFFLYLYFLSLIFDSERNVHYLIAFRLGSIHRYMVFVAQFVVLSAMVYWGIYCFIYTWIWEIQLALWLDYVMRVNLVLIAVIMMLAITRQLANRKLGFLCSFLYSTVMIFQPRDVLYLLLLSPIFLLKLGGGIWFFIRMLQKKGVLYE